jgi:hypothetical protein
MLRKICVALFSITVLISAAPAQRPDEILKLNKACCSRALANCCNPVLHNPRFH